jgi:hypothetical protein
MNRGYPTETCAWPSSSTKISGRWRTEDGIKAFADVRSYIDTGRKHGQNPLSILSPSSSPRGPGKFPHQLGRPE